MCTHTHMAHLIMHTYTNAHKQLILSHTHTHRAHFITHTHTHTQRSFYHKHTQRSFYHTHLKKAMLWPKQNKGCDSAWQQTYMVQLSLSSVGRTDSGIHSPLPAPPHPHSSAHHTCSASTCAISFLLLGAGGLHGDITVRHKQTPDKYSQE